MIQILSALAFAFFLFFWGVYHGSGHTIPADTDKAFMVSIGMSLSIFLLSLYLRKKVFT